MPVTTRSSKGSRDTDPPESEDEREETTVMQRRRHSHDYSLTGTCQPSHEAQAEMYIDNCRKYEVSVDPGYVLTLIYLSEALTKMMRPSNSCRCLLS